MSYTVHMPKELPLGVRLESKAIAALKAAAKADKRPASSLIRKIVEEWLTEHGWLEGDKP